VTVTAVSADSPAALAGIDVDDVIVSVDGVDVQTLEDLAAHIQSRLGQEVVLVISDSPTREVTLVPREDPPEGRGRLASR